jgi:ubiquinone biosynthesis monooxygenase Coq7
MIDKAIIEFDKALRAVFARGASVRPVPGEAIPEADLTEQEKRHVVALMRVNHCGEICAQALYQGQAISSSNSVVRHSLRQAAAEEGDHLAWTEGRLTELGGRKSLLNPIWYGGALAIGIIAGRAGDAWNLGFLAETERQVEAHLQGHLAKLPESDQKTRAIVEAMKADETGHAETAIRLGARELPAVVKQAMKLASGVMTRTAYWV